MKETENTLDDEEIHQLFIHKQKDNKLVQQPKPERCPQFIKFQQQLKQNCVNRKVILQDMGLGLSSASYFAALLIKYSCSGIDKLSCLKLSRNNLRDEGVIELSKGL